MLRFFGWFLALLLAVGIASAQQWSTTGAIADAPLQVGTWQPVKMATPGWVFPMVYLKWATKGLAGTVTVDEYAQAIADEIKRRPADQPIWLQTHAWFGDYRPGPDDDNLLTFAGDNTQGGTPGLWPDQGVKSWRERTNRFLAILKRNKCRVDAWPLDHETGFNEWAHCFQQPDTFRNMVLDPRWNTEPLMGLGLTGSQLLDQEVVRKDKASWQKEFPEKPSDSRLAYEQACIIGHFISVAALEKAFTEPMAIAYPNAVINDYEHYRKPINLGPQRGINVWGLRKNWETLFALKPGLKEIPGVGNSANPSFYGGPYVQAVHPEAKDKVAAMLAEADEIIATYGGDGSKLFPCIATSRFSWDPSGKPDMTLEEYERLLVGLAERGVRKMILFNAEVTDPVVEKETLDTLKKAYAAAEKRLKGK